jgi:DNA-binding PadR family transcriptional regulator
MKALTPAVFHVLLALAAEARHGYGIQKEVLLLTKGEVRLGPGTLYGTLQRLMEAGWVEESGGRRGQEDERRRYYRLTRDGRVALQADAKRLDGLVGTARARNVLPKASRG